MRFVYDNPRQVLGEYNPVDSIAQISPTPLLLPARNDVLTPAASAVAAYEKALEPKRPEILPGGHFDAYVQRLHNLTKRVAFPPPPADLPRMVPPWPACQK